MIRKNARTSLLFLRFAALRGEPRMMKTPPVAKAAGVFLRLRVLFRGGVFCASAAQAAFFLFMISGVLLCGTFSFSGLQDMLPVAERPVFRGAKNTFSGRIRRKNTVRNPRKPDRDLPSERDSEKGRKGTRLPPKAENPPLPTQKTPHKAGPEMREKEGRGRKAA